MSRFPAAVIRLLFSSFVFVMGRAVALPFMALYLYEHLGIDQQTIGWVLGGVFFLLPCSACMPVIWQTGSARIC
ncbi:hypothetical protein UNDYM_4967 [Undibacterium sp. YM2]|uniref:hypothetical protein n=1 Tax=Undibacterium sp. YM2 TaxID=2058625 RepID=UPI001331E223|nr:hypothetical protein [Undibacterium sp. YM2]BBB69220.1 hypothetical protein UNDYM_4967 [Undibacterium sp. YM2]